MPIDALLANLAQEAEAERAAIEQRARARVEEIRARTEAEVGRRRTEALALESDRRQRAADREFASRRRALLERVLLAREQAIGRVLARADTLLGELSAADYGERVPQLVAEVIRHLGERGVLSCPPDVAGLVRDAVPGEGYRVEPVPGAAPGITGRIEDGTLRVDGTYAARLAAMTADLKVELVAALSPSDSEAGDVLG